MKNNSHGEIKISTKITASISEFKNLGYIDLWSLMSITIHLVNYIISEHFTCKDNIKVHPVFLLPLRTLKRNSTGDIT